MTRIARAPRCLAVAAALLGGCDVDVFFFSAQRHEGPYDLSRSTVPADRLDPEGTFLTSADGTRIHLMQVRPSGAEPARAGTTVLFCHGNGGNIGSQWGRVEHLYAMGYGSLIFDYRGWGRSGGRPEEQGIYEDAEAVWSYLRARPEGARVVLYGHSLGAAVCADLAARHPGEAAGLIIESPFRSIAALVEDSSMATLPRGFVTSLRFANDEKIPRIAMPLLVMHGLGDTYLQPRYGQELYDLAQPPKSLWLAEGAGHGDVPGDDRSPRRAEYVARVTGFIDGLP